MTPFPFRISAPALGRIVALAATLGLASCSSTFNREWRQALETRGGAEPRDLTGPWIGTWKSDANGHHGELRCIVSRTPAAGAGDTHRFHYHATFMRTLSATYDVTHLVRQTRDGFAFSGDQKLSGMGGGVYHYDGRGTAREFRATFRSEADHGVFELKRP